MLFDDGFNEGSNRDFKKGSNRGFDPSDPFDRPLRQLQRSL